MSNKILTLKEVVEYLKLAEKTGFKMGGSWRFKKSDIESGLPNKRNVLDSK